MKFGKLFLCTLAAASLFVGCKEKEDFGEPNIKVDPEALEFGSAKESQTIALTATRDWKANDIPSWLTVVPSSGGASSKPQTVTVSVEENKEYDIEGKVTFSIGTFTASLTVKQKGAKGDPSSSMVYYNDFDKEAATKTYGTSGSSWPYLDQFDGWKNQKGSGVENVSYESSGASARTNSAPEPEYGFSGTNNIMISKSAGSYFRVNEISLPAESVNYQLSFGCWKYSGANISNEYFKVYISNDAVKWVELKWTVADVAEDQWWKPVSYNFTLPANTSKLYIHFTGNDSVNDVRIEDLKLIESETAGENIDFSQGIEIGGGTPVDPAGPAKGDGSKENPFNVAAAFAKIKTLEADVESEEFYIAGKVSSIQEVSTQFGNATYYIEDEGYEGSLMVYRGYYINGEKFTSADQIKVGDDVLILGKLINFKGDTPEVTQGNKLISINGVEPKRFSVSTTTASVSADAESYSIKISGNVSWTAEITESADAEAKILSGANGEGDGEVVLQLSKNTTDAERVTKITISTEEEVSQKSFVVTLTQGAPMGEGVITIELSAEEKPSADFPEGSTGLTTEGTYTIAGYSWTFVPSSGNKFSWYTDKYILWGKEGAYILMPAVDGKSLKKVTILTGKNASTSVKVGVYKADGSSSVSGGEEIVLSEKNTEFSWNLSGTEQNSNYQLRVCSAHNAQLQKLTLIYE